MKKISLSTVKNSIRRDELRAIRGGSACSFVCYSYACSQFGYRTECGYPIRCCT